VHELSIAQAVVEIAAAHAARADASAPVRVVAVHVRIGRLRQVVPEALRLGFELCADGTPVEGATLECEDVPIAVVCRACTARRALDGFPLACPACGSFELDVVSGEELIVDALELETEELTRSGTP
jgi:hydrogenase nickel incorporation protein HypA/HybF